VLIIVLASILDYSSTGKLLYFIFKLICFGVYDETL
jgi:hypothetical protein